MSASIIRHEIRCPFREGLHYRPAAAFVQRAKQFACAVRVHKDQQTANGKSITELLTLAAEQGDVLTLEAEGHDASPAIEALTQLLQFDWENDPTQTPPPV
jgi:phosphotransferase system HPr (HPr) family protein